MSTITCISARDLTSELKTVWNEILQANSVLDSPYFQPEFTEAVARVREDVELGIISNQGAVRGFFPFQRSPFGVGKPVGGRLSDFQGVIAFPDVKWSVGDLLRGCGLRSYEFDHWLGCQQSFSPFYREITGSPFLAMPEGYEPYLALLKALGSKKLTEYLRKQRKIERDLGPLRLVIESDSEDDFQQLLAWKTAQYQRTGVFNVFRFPWTLELLRNIWKTRTDDFAGTFSCLYVGDVLVAAHFGMRSQATLHYWFPTYNPEYQHYSPGNLMILEMARAAATTGITKIDFGKGSEEYKLLFGTAQTLVAEGCAQQPSFVNQLSHGFQAAKQWLKKSPMGGPARASARLVRPFREWLAFR